MEPLLIHGAHVIDPSRNLNEQDCDVLIEDGKIAAVGPNLFAAGEAPSLKEGRCSLVEAEGLVCAPGLIDMHVHLRDPGQTYKEDIMTGCRAAAAGGVTAVACMPNTKPTADSPEIIEEILAKAAKADARVYPVAAVTSSLEGARLTDFAALKAAGAVAVSDDGRPVPTGEMMRRAMEEAARVGLPILSHCEDLSIVNGGIINEGAVSRALGVPGIHRASEDASTAREIALAAATGCPIHICHVSTKGSVELIRDARRRGVGVTGETAPHYFALTDARLLSRDADYRMNPPLRTEEDVAAILQGLRDGTLTVIATDHAPHAPEEKADFEKAPNGAVGLETSLAAGITCLVKTGVLPLTRLLELMSWAPAQRLGIPGGTLRPGEAADLILFDPEESWTVDPDRLHGKSRNSSFKGMTLTGKVKLTLLGGRKVFAEGLAPWKT